MTEEEGAWMRFSISRWLEPRQGKCPICGRRSAADEAAVQPVRQPEAASVLRRLCPACASSIPWIRKPACRVCGRPIACPDCPRRTDRRLTFSRAAVRYDPRMKELLALYKYRGSERLEEVMAAMLSFGYERILPELGLAPGASSAFQAVTAVPLADERLEERGFNQAERIAAMLAGWYGLSYRPLLRRNRHTEKQSLKTRRSRMRDMRGNFSPTLELDELKRRIAPDQPVRILLVDDVYTTGSTLEECARVLRTMAGGVPDSRDSRVEVYGLVWARS